MFFFGLQFITLALLYRHYNVPLLLYLWHCGLKSSPFFAHEIMFSTILYYRALYPSAPLLVAGVSCYGNVQGTYNLAKRSGRFLIRDLESGLKGLAQTGLYRTFTLMLWLLFQCTNIY